jgi:hypothetical protein
MATYKELLLPFKKGLRNGNWKRLSRREKALYQASLWYAKQRGCIVKTQLIEKLSTLVEKLQETKGMRIFKRGFEMAVKLLNESDKSGLFNWAPQLRHWLNDPDFIFWLGAMRRT